MYVEYTRKKDLEETRKLKAEGNTEEKIYWRSFGSRINPGRNYSMFGLLAKGVRSDFTNGIPPKGMLDYDEMGYYTADDCYMWIADKGTQPDLGEISYESAMSLISGSYPKKIIYRNGKPRFVANPDWHSHSWLTTQEYENVIENYQNLPVDYSWGDITEYKALLAAMKELESTGEYVARVVFWFDN